MTAASSRKGIVNKAVKKTTEGKARFTFSARTGLIVSGIALTLSIAAGAQERVLLAPQADIPVAQRKDEPTVARLKELQQVAAQTGSVRIIVGLRVPFTPEAELTAAAAAQQREEITQMQSAALRHLPALVLAPDSVSRFETIPFMGLTVSPEELTTLANSPEIISIERDELAAPTLQHSVPHIGGDTAWAAGYSGTGQTVAVLDTGVLKTHPFLQSKVVSEACYSTNSGSTIQSVCPGGVIQSTAVNSGTPCNFDGCDHGTHVSGIIAGGTVGQPSGVAKDAGIIAIQVFSKVTDSSTCNSFGASTPCPLTYTTDQIKGLERVYSLRNTYNIASTNMSLGGGFYSSTCDATQSGRKTIIDQLASAGIATVIASGNDGYFNGISAPACISTAVSVGATWAKSGSGNNCRGNNLGTPTTDSIACYSNSSSFLSLLAPGSSIYSSILDNNYAYFNGTSMAAPHVAGAWAIMKQKKPNATVTEVLNVLKNTGMTITDPRNNITKPRINLAAAINNIGGGTPYHQLTVQASAGGRITSFPAGIDCGNTCMASYPQATSVALTATPNPGYSFAGWNGACAGGTGVCNVAMNSPVTISATFTQTAVQVTLVNAGQGQGFISTNVQSCTQAVCTFMVQKGTVLNLTANPASGSVFSGWGGNNCTGTGSCATTVNTEITIIAAFSPSTGSAGNYVAPFILANLVGTLNSTDHYSVVIPSGAKNLRIETHAGSGDLDLYVRYGQQPTLSTWDCRPWLVGNSEQCNFPAPTPGTYYIMLNGYASYTGATLIITYQLGSQSKKTIVPLLFLLLE